jgi:hypothetical protein
MRSDEQLLGSLPENVFFEALLKATPREEQGRRYVYLEASREGVDQQNEMVLQKALSDERENFLKFGNIDLDHMTIPSVAKRHGIDNPQAYEIGMPVEVTFRDGATLVKAELYSGDTPLAGNANMVWDSMTKLSPAKRWYPSVGGAVLAKSIKTIGGQRVAVIDKVRWNNLAISQTPVNQHVHGISTVPFGALAKSWTADGLVLGKSLEAGYGSDMAALTGGDAFRIQSLDGVPQTYEEFRDAVSGGVLSLLDLAGKKFGISSDAATEWTARFLRDLKN